MKKQLSTFLFFFFVMLGVGAQDLHHLNKDLPCINKHFNMHLVIFPDSTGDINFDMASFNQAIESTNTYFSPICFSFGICEIDTMTNYNFNKLNLEDELDPLGANHTIRNRLNIFIIDSLVIDGNDGPCGLGGGNRVILQRNCYSALAHELGHVFGLEHTFAGTANVNDPNCDQTGDGICDTPADPYTGNPNIVWQIDCEFVFEGVDANGEFYQPDIGNIMSYYGCDCGFTRGQYLRMIETYLNKPKMW